MHTIESLYSNNIIIIYIYIYKKIYKIIYVNLFSLICIYCEGTFKDRMVLKEHMRKKFHKCINPHDKTYDKFYINNYLKPERIWEKKQVQFEIRNVNISKISIILISTD